jgi:hypothetical protein
MPDSLKKYAPWALAALMAASSLWAWNHPEIVNVPGPTVTEYQQVEVPKPYRVISKVTVTVTEIKVLEKEKVIEKEKWPEWFSGDPNQQLTAIGLVEPYRGQTECASVINLASGESRIVTKRLPLSVFGFANDLRLGVGAAYVFDHDGLRQQFDFHAGWDFARAGNWYVNAYGEANTRPEGIVKLNADLHF